MTRAEEMRLIERVKRGHAEAFRELVEAYKGRLFAFVWRMLRNHHEAEDVCQSAFLKAFESLDSYSSRYAFSTWLYTIAYRMCLNTMRKRKKGQTTADVDFARIGRDEDDASATLANSEEARRLRDAIWSAVEDLTPAQKACVMLFYQEQQSCDEIGRTLEMPAVTVKSHLHRAREKLRRLLSGQLVEDWMSVEFGNESRPG